ncbi:MAG: B12-binding domain-containing radical SAM protein [Candidatus Caldarchaeum sp.]|nr:B12-binding domain-containing radical SAM protein [Candidatus Caldarchaeum sp.]MDW8435081.1 radical SAM protein [Candidatus Caldarchaeum sp.]
MVQVVLTFDPSLGHRFHDFPLLSFLPCAPVKFVPGPVYYYLSLPDTPYDPLGRAVLAPYAIRKIEACLVKKSQLEVVVAHPRFVSRFIGPDTKIIGVNTMDPLGIGPLTLMFNNAGREKSWVTKEFEDLMTRIRVAKKNSGSKAKVLVGGAGEWEFEHRREEIDRLGIDHVVQGEMDDIIHLLFEQLIEDSLDHSIFMYGHKTTTFDAHGRPFIRYVKDPEGKFICRNPASRYKLPKIDDIPTIVNPAISGQAEIMRGCGIDCDFCEVTTRPLRYYPPEKVLEEVMVNRRGGIRNAWFVTDNQWAYMVRDPQFWPNKEAIFKLYRTIMPYVVKANPMHATLAPVAADPETAMGVAKIVGAGPDKHIGVQIGLETGSDKLVLKHMVNKAKPLKVGVDGTWAEIVVEAQKVYNAAYWIPAYTIILGQEGETDDDNWDTIGLINYMASLNLYFTVTPMALVNLGSLRGTNILTDVYASLTPVQAALIYVSWRNTKRMAESIAFKISKDSFLFRILTTTILNAGARFWLDRLEKYFTRLGREYEKAIDKAKTYTSIKTTGTDFNRLREKYKAMKISV